jgi:hypothetical protein
LENPNFGRLENGGFRSSWGKQSRYPLYSAALRVRYYRVYFTKGEKLLANGLKSGSGKLKLNEQIKL